MNKQDLITNVSSAAAGDKLTAIQAVEFTLVMITNALARGEDVKISGFGTFKRVATKPRICRNPHTGEAIEVPAGHKIKFKASSKLKE